MKLILLLVKDQKFKLTFHLTKHPRHAANWWTIHMAGFVDTKCCKATIYIYIYIYILRMGRIFDSFSNIRTFYRYSIRKFAAI